MRIVIFSEGFLGKMIRRIDFCDMWWYNDKIRYRNQK